MIVITTPAGNIGRQVLEDLLDSGEQLRAGRPRPVGHPRGHAAARRGDRGLPWRPCRRGQGIRRRGRRVLADSARPARGQRRGRLRRVHPPGRRGVQEARRPAGRGRLGARPRYPVGRTGRLRHRLAGDGRPDRRHRCRLPGADQPVVHGQHRRARPGRSRTRACSSRPSTATASCRPSPPATSRPRRRACSWTTAGAAPARFRCSAPRICPSTTWPRSSPRSSAQRCASSRSLSGLQGQVHRLRHVRRDGSGDDRHGLGEERRPGQRRCADAGKLDADQFPPVVPRGAQACRPGSGRGGRFLTPAGHRIERQSNASNHL